MSNNTMPKSLGDFENLPNVAFVRLPVVEILFACSRASVWRFAKAGLIPSPKKLSSNITAWNVGELRQALLLRNNG